MTVAGTWTLCFDGGSNGNPGPSAGAAVLVRPDGQILRTSTFIGHATNNQAEYAGLICGLQLAVEAGCQTLVVKGDSKLVVNQVAGIWKTKDAALRTCLVEARQLVERFRVVEMHWIPREENSEADAEVRRCLAAQLPDATPMTTAESSTEVTPERYLGVGKYAAINRKPPGQASFQDLASLKVGGQDEFSRKKRDALLELLGAEASAAVAAINAALTNGKPNLAALLIAKQREKLELTALRWTARGLLPEHAGQKVLVDLELSLNVTRGRR